MLAIVLVLTFPQLCLLSQGRGGGGLFQQSVTGTLIQSEVLLPHGEELLATKIIRCTLDENGKVLGKHSSNPILNTLMYGVELPYGTIRPYAENVIANNIYAQVDS